MTITKPAPQHPLPRQPKSPAGTQIGINKPNAAFFTHSDPLRPGNRIDYIFSHGRQEEIATLCNLHPARITPDNFETEVENLNNLDVIFSTWGMFPLSAEQLDRMPNLKAVFYAAGTVKHFAQPFLDRGIKVTTAVEANAIPVAEFCLSQILLAAKGYFANHTKCRKKIFNPCEAGRGNYGETVALLGIGAISRQLLTLLKPFNHRIIAVSSYLEKNPDLARAMGIRELVSIEEAFKQSYVISNHLPNLPSNQKIFTDHHFSMMREGATFINTGRGQQVNEEDLIKVMRHRPDLTALLDVTDPEPPLPDSPLYDVPNIWLSSHIAGSQNDETVRMADYAIEECRRFIAGEPLRHEVTAKMLETIA